METIQQLNFEKDRVQVMTELDFNKYAQRWTKSFKYNTEGLSKEIQELMKQYVWNWSNIESGHTRSFDKENVLLYFKVSGKSIECRKRKGAIDKHDFNDATLKRIEESKTDLDKYDMEYAINRFEVAFKEANEKIREQQIQRLEKRYGTVEGYKFNDVKEIVEVEEKLKQMREEFRKQENEMMLKIRQLKTEVLVKAFSKENDLFDQEVSKIVVNKIKENNTQPLEGRFKGFF